MKSPRLLQAMTVLIALFLPLWIASCASAPPQPVKVCPPQTLLQERSTPPWDGKTWGDLARWTEDLMSTNDEQNADKAAASKFCQPREAKP